MPIFEFLVLIKRPLILIVLILGLGTLVHTFYDPSPGVVKTLLLQLDLNKEYNLASVLEAYVFLLCGLSFVPLSLGEKAKYRVSTHRRMFFALIIIVLFFFSLDEILDIHERLGSLFEKRTGIFANTPLHGIGFSYLLVYGPLVLVGLFFLWRMYAAMTRGDPEKEFVRRKIGVFFFSGVLAVTGIIAVGLIQAVMWRSGQRSLSFTFIEEFLELAALFSFMICNQILLENLEL